MPRDLPSDISHPAMDPALVHHSIPLEQWLIDNSHCRALAIGAFILRSSPTGDQPQMLLLKRSPTDSYPNMWEPPGGAVDLEDETVLHGLVREVWEETGLRTTKITRQIWAGNNDGKTEVEFPGRHGEIWRKANFLVDVQRTEDGGFAVQLDVDEHQDWGWFTSEQMEGLPFITQQAREIARNAYAVFGEGVKS